MQKRQAARQTPGAGTASGTHQLSPVSATPPATCRRVQLKLDLRTYGATNDQAE